jgi:hypothetical protein
VSAYRLVAQPRADLDVVAAYQWYESERAGLGMTRAREELCVSYHGESRLMGELQGILTAR